MARLHGYPDWFRFNWTKAHGARQVGNSVPPRLGRVVASSVVAAMGIELCRPKEILDVGDEVYVLVNKSSPILLLAKDSMAY